MKKTFSVFINIVLVILVLEAILMTVFSFLKNEEGIVQVKEDLLITAINSNMEPAIGKNDLVLVRRTEKKQFMENSVVAYYDNQKEIHIGRISSVEQLDNGHYNYHLIFDDSNDKITIGYDNIIGLWTSSKIPFIGIVFQSLLSQTGFLFGVILPLFVIFIYQIIRFIYSLKYEKKQKSI